MSRTSAPSPLPSAMRGRPARSSFQTPRVARASVPPASTSGEPAASRALPATKPGSTLTSPVPATWPATAGRFEWSVITRPAPLNDRPCAGHRLLSLSRATAVAHTVVTMAAGVPTSVTWRACSVASQRTRRPGPPVTSRTTLSSRAVPSSTSTPRSPRTSDTRRTAPPRSSLRPSTWTRLAVPVSLSPCAVTSLSSAPGELSVMPPASTVRPSAVPATVTFRAVDSAPVTVMAPSSIRSPSTASANAWPALARTVHPARSKPTQYVVAASALPATAPTARQAAITARAHTGRKAMRAPRRRPPRAADPPGARPPRDPARRARRRPAHRRRARSDRAPAPAAGRARSGGW